MRTGSNAQMCAALLLLLQVSTLATGQEDPTTISSLATTLGDLSDTTITTFSTQSGEGGDLSTTTEQLQLPAGAAAGADVADCPPEQVNFELVTGYLFSTPADSRQGTLLLSDCVDTCRANVTCRGFNYETGLCVLIDSTADQDPGALTESQFPVFTMYLQKMCYASSSSSSSGTNNNNAGGGRCNKAWAFERVLNHTLAGRVRRNVTVASRAQCEAQCLDESDFVCRSASYKSATGECQLSDMDRHTTAGLGLFRSNDDGTDYLENNCVDEPVKLCEFRKINSRILKTVDAVHQDVESLDACRQLCMDADLRCHTYDYNEVADQVCRLSHHAVATLTHIEDPYLEIPDATSYELSACYNVTIDCRAGDMTARVKTSKVFSGKVYAKDSPNSCMNDVSGSLEFELTMSYTDPECNVQRDRPGRYHNDIVLQHHDRIVTSADLGLRVHCQYDLSNQTVANTVDLEVKGDIQPVLEEEAVVEAPNVQMHITDRDGSELQSASVGDALSLRFQIVDEQSPYEIFVRELIAMDGSNVNEIVLIDADGCPTDEAIMGALTKVNGTKELAAPFDAFKFPTSDVVQFRALVTPCLPRCEPVNCQVRDYIGNVRSVDSFGRRRRRRSASVAGDDQDLLVVQTIRIEERFAEPRGQQLTAEDESAGVTVQDAGHGSGGMVRGASSLDTCVNTVHLIIGATAFLLLQLLLLTGWLFVWQHRRRQRSSKTMLDDFPETTTSSLAQLYESGYTARRS